MCTALPKTDMYTVALKAEISKDGGVPVVSLVGSGHALFLGPCIVKWRDVDIQWDVGTLFIPSLMNRGDCGFKIMQMKRKRSPHR
jgi:hypothetical protein